MTILKASGHKSCISTITLIPFSFAYLVTKYATSSDGTTQ